MVFRSASLSFPLDLLHCRSALLWVFFVFPSASGSWQKEEGWLLICRCRCVRAVAGGCWVCERWWSEEASRRPVCAKESWWVRKGTTSVGAVVPGLQLEAGWGRWRGCWLCWGGDTAAGRRRWKRWRWDSWVSRDAATLIDSGLWVWRGKSMRWGE